LGALVDLVDQALSWTLAVNGSVPPVLVQRWHTQSIYTPHHLSPRGLGLRSAAPAVDYVVSLWHSDISLQVCGCNVSSKITWQSATLRAPVAAKEELEGRRGYKGCPWARALPITARSNRSASAVAIGGESSLPGGVGYTRSR
jgi:hypothetical protein